MAYIARYNFTNPSDPHYVSDRPISQLDPYKRLIATSMVVTGIALLFFTSGGGGIAFAAPLLCCAPGLVYGVDPYSINLVEFISLLAEGVIKTFRLQSPYGPGNWEGQHANSPALASTNLGEAIFDFMVENKLQTHGDFDLTPDGIDPEIVQYKKPWFAIGASVFQCTSTKYDVSAPTIDTKKTYQFVSSLETLDKTTNQSLLAKSLADRVYNNGYLLVSLRDETQCKHLFTHFSVDEKRTKQFRRVCLDSVYPWLPQNIVVLQKKSTNPM